MKGTDEFTKTIKAYLDKRSADDEAFATKYADKGKSVEGCVDYIIDAVHKSGCNGFSDDEIYGMAVHYYDEKDVKAGGKNNPVSVVVNHTIELTEEDKKEAHDKAMQDLEMEYVERMKKRAKKPVKKTEAAAEQPTLF
jgi:3-oxoacyl-ACP reductase-like protein